MISFSSVTKSLVAASIMIAPTAGFAQKKNSCQGAGCVLPLPRPAAPLPPLEAAPAPAPVEAVPVEAVARRGIGILPLIIGAALIGLIAFFLLRGDDEDEAPASP